MEEKILPAGKSAGSVSVSLTSAALPAITVMCRAGYSRSS